MNLWAIFTNESNIFDDEDKNESEIDENKRISRFLPSDVSFTYAEKEDSALLNKDWSEDLLNFRRFLMKEMPSVKHSLWVNKSSKVYIFIFAKERESTIYKSWGDVDFISPSGKPNKLISLLF